MPDFAYQPILEHGHDDTAYRRLDDLSAGVRAVDLDGRRFLEVSPETLRGLAAAALDDISHLLRPHPPRPAAAHPGRPRGQRQRPLRRPGAAHQREHRGRSRASGVSGHGDRDRGGLQGRAGDHGQ